MQAQEIRRYSREVVAWLTERLSANGVLKAEESDYYQELIEEDDWLFDARIDLHFRPSPQSMGLVAVGHIDCWVCESHIQLTGYRLGAIEGGEDDEGELFAGYFDKPLQLQQAVEGLRTWVESIIPLTVASQLQRQVIRDAWSTVDFPLPDDQ